MDADEAFRAGIAAAERLAESQSGAMVAFVRKSDAPYEVALGAAALTEVANSERRMPADFLVGQGTAITSVSEAFRRYAAPLIGPAPEPHFSLASFAPRSP